MSNFTTTAGYYSLYSLYAYVFVETYIVPVLCVLALIGNVLVLLVASRSKFRNETGFVLRSYYVAFALADIGVVIFYDLPNWSGALFLRFSQVVFAYFINILK